MNDELQFIIDFYQKSWDNLLWVIGGTGAFLGIIWPILMSSLNDKRLEVINDEIDKQISNAINKIDEKEKKIDEKMVIIESRIDEKMKSFESRIVKVEKEGKCLIGYMYFGQAQTASDPIWKLFGFLNAYLSFIEAKNTDNMTMTYTCLLPYLQKNQPIEKNSFNTELLNKVKPTVEQIIYGLNQLNDDMYGKYQINIFEDFRKRLDE